MGRKSPYPEEFGKDAAALCLPPHLAGAEKV